MHLGTPLYNGSTKQIIYSACKETEVYLKCGLVSYINIWMLSVLKGTRKKKTLKIIFQ